MAGLGYQVTIGAFQASSQAGRGSGRIRSIMSELSLEGAGGRCHLELVPSDSALPVPGEAMTVRLEEGSERVTVFTGGVMEIQTTPELALVVGVDALAKLARLEVSEAYEQTSAGAIVGELVQRAGAPAGTIDEGPTFPRYVLHPGPRALGHVRRLAEQCGFDVYTDGSGRVHFTAPRTGAADHTFRYRTQVLRVRLRRGPPALDGVVVWGEGAASDQGADKAHWLVADLSSVRGKAALDDAHRVRPGGDGTRSREVRDGAVRTGEAAATQARMRMAALASRPLHGFIEVLGAPAVRPADLIQLDDIPPSHPVHALASRQVLRVRGVRHTLSARAGFVTRMEL